METTKGILTTISSTVSPLAETFAKVSFSWYDYALFCLMLGLSVVIGIYFGCFGSKQATTNEYLLGSKKMKVVPIAFSLVASHVSGITLLALPADVYKFGATYWWICATMIVICLVTSYVFLPIFMNLGITSTYEYLERRFDNKTRLMASLMFALSVVLHLPIVIYIPALAVSAATGINVHYITPFVCGICIFYTTIGGLKAVVWTDTLQFTVTLGAMASVFTLGVISTGGLTAVWNKAIEGHRLELDFDWDPTKRDTFWTVIFGFTITWIAHSSVNQGCIQKFLAVSNIREANKAVFLFGFGIIVVKTASVLTGLIMYAKYAECDPFTTGHVERNDQLLPYYILDVAGKIPGLPGLFISGVFSTALSTLSANLNCLAGTVYEDFIVHKLPEGTSQERKSNILKAIVVISGVLCTSLVFIIEHLGGILPLAISFTAICGGPTLGMFTLGALFPRANKHGAFYGSIAGLIFLAWIVFSAQFYKAKGLLIYPSKPVSTDSCEIPFNTTIPMTIPIAEAEPTETVFFLFRISYYYYTLIGATVTIVVGLVISYLTNKYDPPVSKDVLSPVVHWMLPKESVEDKAYYSVQKALHLVTVNSSEKEKDEKA